MKKFIGTLAVLALPFVTFGAVPQLTNTEALIGSVSWLISLLLPIVVSLALLFFFWGLAMFIYAQGNEEKKKEGRNIMTWGVVALFVMVSVWGIVDLIAIDLGVYGSDTIIMNVPTVNFTVPTP